MAAARPPRSLLTVLAALIVATVGMSAAGAQDPSPQPGASGNDPASLLERLAELEPELPGDPPPTGAVLDAETTWGTLDGDPAATRSVLTTLEPQLRSLFVDADAAAGDVADAVALVARGWLDIWTGTSSIAAADGHDLAFPIDTRDAAGVATGADELRGEIEVGIELVLAGRARHLEGYVALSELGEAPADAQARFDARATAAEEHDAAVRPVLVLLLSQPTTSVAVPTNRFETVAPGVESRATSMQVACVDREVLEAITGPLTEEVIAEFEEVDRVDCPDLPSPLDE